MVIIPQSYIFVNRRFRMIALKLTEIGTFINKLLKDGMCDHFLLQEAVITQAATYTIDGSFHPDYYEPEELVGKTLIAITNLPPRKMMGIESCGMLLSAVNNLKDSEDEELHLIMVDNHIPAGAKLY